MGGANKEGSMANEEEITVTIVDANENMLEEGAKKYHHKSIEILMKYH